MSLLHETASARLQRDVWRLALSGARLSRRLEPLAETTTEESLTWLPRNTASLLRNGGSTCADTSECSGGAFAVLRAKS